MPLAAAVTAPVLTAPVLTAPVLSAPVPTATAVIEQGPPSWPCSGCSEQVSFEATVCPRCGTEFMGGVNPNVSLKVPGVGDLVGMSAGAKFGVMAGGAAVLATVLVLILMVLGHIF